MREKVTTLAVACVFLFLAGCATSVHQRIKSADAIAASSGMTRSRIKTSSFHLTSYERLSAKSDQDLHIYIEGDGRVVTASGQPSPNPTPLDPIGLKLAALDRSGAHVVYLGRPCQYRAKYEDGRECAQRNWTSHRYSKEIVSAMNEAIGQSVNRLAPRKISLIGFSGGGTIALLVAIERDDINKVITMAAPLDQEYLTDAVGDPPLIGSLDPLDFREELGQVTQVHLVGGRDTVVPKETAYSYLRKMREYGGDITIVEIADAEHTRGWESALLTTSPQLL